MADNITVKDASAASVVIAAKDVSSVFVPASTPVTPANVTMVGTAGAAAAGVLTVQGIASGTVVPTSSSDLVPLLTSVAAVSATFTPAASSHTAKDVVGGANTFTSVGTSAKMLMICGATFSIDTTTPVASAFRLHMFNAAPTVIADDAAFTLASGDIGKYLGWIELGTAFDLDSTAQWISQNGLAIPVLLTTANIIGYLQNLTTVTLEAVAHKVTLFTYPLS